MLHRDIYNFLFQISRLNNNYCWNFIMGNLFFYYSSVRANFAILAGMQGGASRWRYQSRRHDVIHVHTRRKRIYLQDVLGTSDSSLRDHCVVPGSRKSITIRWRHGRSLSRRRSRSTRIAFRSHETKRLRAS